MTLSLVAQRDRLKARMEADGAKLAVVEQKIASRGRRHLQRLKVVVGQVLLRRLYDDEDSRHEWYAHLDKVLTRPHDRAVFLARYPKAADAELLAEAEEQARASPEIAKLDWRLALLLGAAALNRAPVDPNWRDQLRKILDHAVQGKRDRAIIAELYVPVTATRG